MDVPQLVPTDAANARLAIVAALGFRPPADPRIAALDGRVVAAEALRAALWAAWAATREPVAIQRVVSIAGRLVLPVRLVPAGPEGGRPDDDTEGRREFLRDVLGDLAAIGDAAELPRGRWLPAPTRLVPLEDAGGALLIGGLPIRRLDARIRSRVTPAGVARLVHGDVPGLPRQPVHHWLSAPDGELVEWTKSVLAATPMVDFDGPLEGEVYAPGSARPFAYQYHRWRGDLAAAPDGRHLVRLRPRFGGQRVVLADFASGRVLRTGELRLDAGERRRMLYGLDALAGNPTRAKVTVGGNRCVLTLRNALPAAEERLLTALGQLQPPETDGYYPRAWSLPREHLKPVLDKVAELGMQIDQGDGEP